jgi:hypothetical protein
MRWLRDFRKKDGLCHPRGSVHPPPEGLLPRQDVGKAFRLAVRQQERIIDYAPATIGRPAPATCVTVDRARSTLDLDQDESSRRQDKQIDLINPALVIHELKVRPCPPRFVIGQVLPEKLQSLTFPVVCGRADYGPARRFHSIGLSFALRWGGGATPP